MENKRKILCSACLLGVNCRYNGQTKPNEKVIALFKEEVLIPVCPEQLGGLPTPRTPAETTGDGSLVLNGKAKVMSKTGVDVTESFTKGAKEVLKLAKLFDISEAILKQRSPSCGCGKIPDGTFSNVFVRGDGVLAALLKQNGLKIISEEDL